MPGFSKTLKERFKSKWAKQQIGAGAIAQKKENESTNLTTRRVPVIEKRTKKLKKRSKKRRKQEKR